MSDINADTKQDMAGIIERLEAASGSDELKGLEENFLRACFPGAQVIVCTGDDGGDEWHVGAWSSNPHPFYSIDAALSLVPEGFGAVSMSFGEGDRGSSARIGHPYVYGNAKSLPIAIAIAALRARANKG